MSLRSRQIAHSIIHVTGRLHLIRAARLAVQLSRMAAFIPAAPPTARSKLFGLGLAPKCTRRCTAWHSRPRTGVRIIPSTTIRAAVEPLILSEATVEQALDEVKIKLGSVFGNSEENRDVGITGEVALASLDGPIVVLRLSGRFWHKRADVFARVSAYLNERIPEICDTEIEDPSQLLDDEKTAAAM